MWSVRFVAILAFPTILVGGAPAAVPEFPNKPIRCIVAIGPGGASDLIGRTLGPPLSEPIGLIVSNPNVLTLATERARWANVVKDVGIQPQLARA